MKTNNHTGHRRGRARVLGGISLLLMLSRTSSVCAQNESFVQPVPRAPAAAFSIDSFNTPVPVQVQEQPQPNEQQQRLVNAIQNLGGRLDIDSSADEWIPLKVVLTTTNATDCILQQLADYPSLKSLYLSPATTDEDLVHVSKLKNLKTLDMSNTPVTDRGLRRLAGLVKLEALNLKGTNVTGTGCVSLTLAPLTSLNMELSLVNDDGLAAISRIPTLTSLMLEGCVISDDGLAHLSKLTKLKTLDLSSTSVTDDGLQHLAALKNLESLTLTGSGVTGPGVARLKDLKNLQTLTLMSSVIGDEELRYLIPLPSLRSVSLSQTTVTRAAAREFWRVNPRINLSYIEVMPEGDPEAAYALLREIGDEAIADRERRLIEESSPAKRELMAALRKRDERVTSYRFRWKQIRHIGNGTQQEEDDGEYESTCSLTVDGHRIAFDTEGQQENYIYTPTPVTLGGVVQQVMQQTLGTPRTMRSFNRFDGEYARSLSEFPDIENSRNYSERISGMSQVESQDVWPVIWAYSPFEPAIVDMDWRGIEVLDEAETIDGKECLVIRYADEESGVYYMTEAGGEPKLMPSVRTWWIDPSREHVIVRFATTYGEQMPNQAIDIQYQQHDEHGWVPSGWKTSSPSAPGSTEVIAEVTDYELNPQTTDEEFHLEAPAGTNVINLGF